MFNQYFSNYPDEGEHALILLAGPLLHVLIGSFFLFHTKSKPAQILCIATLPLSRILAFVSGGGDELHAFQLLFPQNAYILGAILVLLFNSIILYQLFGLNSTIKEKIQIGVLLIVFSLTERLVLSLLNSINQIIPTQTILGTPLLIWIWMGFLSILTGIYYLYVQKQVE